MHWIKRLSLLTICYFIASCGEQGPLHKAASLPFPTPAQHDLVVLTTPGPLTYSTDDNGNPIGLEYDLTQAFAQELGVDVKYEIVEPGELESRLANTKYHIATAWLSPGSNSDLQATPPIFLTRDVLAQHDASLPLTDPKQLAGKTVHVMAGTRQAKTMRRLSQEIPGIQVVEVGTGDILELLEKVGEHSVQYVAMDENFEDIADQYIPNLRTSLALSETQPVVWQLGKQPNPELRVRLDAFIERVQHDGTLARIEDRYLGHLKRLDQADIIKFLGEVETTLPKYRKYFLAAQALTGIDWRLIASVSYHESRWDPNATSYTNVRGIMMLTEETADRLQVGNRLDPSESILAGARYINMLKDLLPDEVEEPDRTWLALAAYNIGPGHFNSARVLAKQLKADPNAWYDMKRVLPKLAQAKYAQLVKSGRARGGEAVILVENIRNYYDILLRNADPFAPTPSAAEGLKRLVMEVEERRKAYVKRIAAAKAITTVTSTDESGTPALRLPTIDQNTSPVAPANTGQVESLPKS